MSVTIELWCLWLRQIPFPCIANKCVDTLVPNYWFPLSCHVETLNTILDKMRNLNHPSHHFNDAKVVRFLQLRAFIIALEGMGDSRFILFCPRLQMTLEQHFEGVLSPFVVSPFERTRFFLCSQFKFGTSLTWIVTLNFSICRCTAWQTNCRPWHWKWQDSFESFLFLSILWYKAVISTITHNISVK